jgi:riboflavin kinase / FMN adenylyltransferase
MKIFRSIEALPTPAAPSAVAIGNFDGVHRGHAAILRTLDREGRARGLRTSVLTFSPHPERVFGAGRISMIQTLEQRLDAIAGFGPDILCVQAFRSGFAGLMANEFVHRVLVSSFGASLVVVGADFRFGRARAGSLPELSRLGRRHGFGVRIVPPVSFGGDCVSSSLVRELLAAGRIGRANGLLGRPYAIDGDVVSGAGRGRELGFPTANIATPNEIVPPGVFVTGIEIDGREHPSVTNVGIRPTFGACEAVTIETHVLGFGRDLYGASVRLRFLRRIRGERSFSGPAELRARIRADVAAARAFFTGGRDMV